MNKFFKFLLFYTFVLFIFILFISLYNFLPNVNTLGKSKTYLQRDLTELSIFPYNTPDFTEIENLSENSRREELQFPCFHNNFDRI